MRNLNLGFGTESRVVKTELQIVSKVRPSSDPRTPTARSAEHISKTEDIAKDVAEVGEDAGIKAAGAGTQPCMAESIVVSSFLSVAEHRIGLGSFLESLFGAFVSRIAIGMVLEGEFSIGALNFLFRCTTRNAQNVVEVAFFPAQIRCPFGDMPGSLRVRDSREVLPISIS